MGLLEHEEQQKLIELFLKLPNMDDLATRRSLLAGLPDGLRNSISMADIPRTHIISMVDMIDSEAWTQLPDDTWSIIRVLDNSISLVRGSRLEKELQTLLDTLKARAMKRTYEQAPQPKAEGLTGAQYKEFHHALLRAFPSRNALEKLVLFHLNERLGNIVAGESLSDIAFNLIQWAASRGLIESLLMAARSDNPGNPELRAFAEKFGSAPVSPPSRVVEKVIAESKSFFDIDAWRAGMSEVEPTVCRVEINAYGNKGYGTGFLVGPSVVMTCSHVVEELINNPQGAGKDITLLFGYKTSGKDMILNQGQEYHLADDWLIASSPSGELDYALLRVDGTPGDDPVGGQAGAPPRRWLRPDTDYVFRPGDPLFMIQHPHAEPLKISFETDAIISINDERTRVLYRIDTEPGSGGSPCFNYGWKLVALHHASWYDEATKRSTAVGIPIATIAAEVQGHLGT